jgi:uncharacterized protein (DUF58 family)
VISSFKNIFIHLRFFKVTGILILAFVLAFPFPVLFPIAKTLLVIFAAMLGLDVILLFKKSNKIDCERNVPRIMSLGSENVITIKLNNNSPSAFSITLIDELPYQLQIRNNQHIFQLMAHGEKEIVEIIRPVKRGEYHFGKVHLFLTSKLSLLQRRISYQLEQTVPVYPSIQDVKKFELRTVSKLSTFLGIKKTRRLGQSYEFDQISEYSVGDNYQSMNWKATSKSGQLMVNRYTDEKAQHIYSFIDKSRYMKMPFEGMTLLDYAINASLIIASSSIKKDDRAGLLTFSDKVETLIKADNRRTQLSKILETLYREGETKKEANYELLYNQVRRSITQRSLIFLFANFDTSQSLERVLPILRKLNMFHVLVVIVFENTELETFQREESLDVLDIYNHTIAQKITSEKRRVLSDLKKHAIQIIYTKPENLSLNALNKYLELKARGMI